MITRLVYGDDCARFSHSRLSFSSPPTATNLDFWNCCRLPPHQLITARLSLLLCSKSFGLPWTLRQDRETGLGFHLWIVIWNSVVSTFVSVLTCEPSFGFICCSFFITSKDRWPRTYRDYQRNFFPSHLAVPAVTCWLFNQRESMKRS